MFFLDYRRTSLYCWY